MTDLPPDPDGMNDQRAEWAQLALTPFCHATGSWDPDESITDLIADLMHLCDRSGLDPQTIITRAIDHYEAETTDGQ